MQFLLLTLFGIGQLVTSFGVPSQKDLDLAKELWAEEDRLLKTNRDLADA